ncbi:MAG: hypothetical protein RQ824_11345, partial [bacterium]|nr:hypothetical protein [bacterium]
MQGVSVNLAVLSLAWLIFFVLHSLLASIRFKDLVKKRFPSFTPYYRLAYNIVSILLIIPIFLFSHSIDSPPLIMWDGALSVISAAAIILALAGFFWTVRYYDMAEFLGTRQLREKNVPLEGSDDFTLSPLHRFVRHPWYFLALVILWTRDMNLPFLVTAVAATIYFIIGSRLEEKKLLFYYG